MRLSTPGWCPCCRCSGGCRLLATARYTVSARGRVPASTAGLAPRRTNLWPGGPRRRIARGNWLAGAGAGAGAAVPARLCGCQPGTGLLPRGTISAVSSPSAKPRRVPRPGWAGQQVTRGTECLAADLRTLGTYQSSQFGHHQLHHLQWSRDTGHRAPCPRHLSSGHTAALGWSLRPRADGVFARPRLNIEHEDEERRAIIREFNSGIRRQRIKKKLWLYLISVSRLCIYCFVQDFISV